MIKKILAFACVCASLNTVNAQSKDTLPKSKYDPHVLFSPLFYKTFGNEYRGANGEPGPAYWQNKADYAITASLNEETHEIKGTVTITYKNNSPFALPYIWLQMDENLYDLNSRGQAKMPATGRSRYGDAKSTFEGGYKVQSVKIIGANGSKDANYLVNDTRMQIKPTESVAAKGGVLKVKIEYSYAVPMEGSDRTGILKPRTVKYLPLPNGIRVYACLMIYKAGIPCLI